VVANLAWKNAADAPESLQRLLVWDTEAPCGGDRMYIHYAGEADGVTKAPMTAGAGALVHTYMAGYFETLPVPAGTTGCYAATIDMHQCSHAKEWQVARHGTPCPESEDESN